MCTTHLGIIQPHLTKLGTFDPLPNARNEKLVSINIQRIKYWMGERNAQVAVPVLELLGLSGLLPIHPRTYIRAIESREKLEAERVKKEKMEEQRRQEEQEAAAASNSQESSSGTATIGTPV